MEVNHFVVLKQLKKYQKKDKSLQSSLISQENNNSKSISSTDPNIGNKIDALGKSVEDLCKTAFRDDSDKDNNPFDGLFFSVNANSSLEDMEKNRIKYDVRKINHLENFIKRKKDKIKILLQSKPIPTPQENSSLASQTTIGNVGTYVAGNAINITNIVNILQELEKEVKSEPNLTLQEKEELQNLIQEESTRWNNVKEGFAKYGGKFAGHALRSFVGMPDI